MKQTAKRRLVGVLVVAALASSGIAIVAAGAIAADEPTACETVSLSFVQKTLGLPHSSLLRDKNNLEDTSGEDPSELPHSFHSECGIGLWSGAPPKSEGAIFEKARAGQAAQVAVDVWAPDSDSPDVNVWEEHEFGKLTEELVKGRFQLIVHFPGKAKSLNPKGEGYIGAGFTIKATGRAHGLEAATACWWAKASSRVVCVLTEEAEGKPVVAHLNALAGKIVPNFLGAP